MSFASAEMRPATVAAEGSIRAFQSRYRLLDEELRIASPAAQVYRPPGSPSDR